MSAMKRLFQLMAEKRASDIFMAVSSPIHIKINGVVVLVNQQVMDTATITKLLYEVLNEKQIKEFEEQLELNVAYAMPGIGVFRISAMRQKNTPAVVVRYIPDDIPAIDTLELPEALKEIILAKRGLILIAGTTGSGKSTSLAAMLDYRNELTSGHILTLEDPIEFIFKNKKSIVNQREIGTDTLDFKTALRNALRQAPDCILIGEVRDQETLAASIAYAQSGHLCLATLHANNSFHALNRLLGFYPPENRPALLQDLGGALKCIISQRLVHNKVGGRCAAVEVILNTRHITELIEKGQVSDIKDVMDRSMSPGSQTFEQAFFRMIREGKITQEEGMANADSPSNLTWLLNNTDAGVNDAPADVEMPKQSEQVKVEESGGVSFTEFTLITDDVK